MSVDAKTYQKRAARLFFSETAGEDPYSLKEFDQNKKCVPAYLYKYHGVDDYTLDALRNGYVYIAPAHLMDDQFELALNMIEGIRDIGGLHQFDEKYARYLWDTLAETSPAFEAEIRRMKEALCGDLSVSRTDSYIRDLVAADPEFSAVREKLTAVSTREGYEQYVERFMDQLLRIKEEFGLYSMTEDKYNQVMWTMYGSDYRGILIEYDMSTAQDSFIKDLVAVRYSDSRDADPLKLFVDMIVSFLAESKGQSYYRLQLLEWMIKVLATKNSEWSFQKEWREISRPAEKVPSPGVSAIYLGKRISDEDRERVTAVAAEKGIALFEQKDNFEQMTIRYEKL